MPLPPKRLPRLVITLLIIGPVLLALAIGVPVGLAALRGSHSALAESQKESAGAKNSNKTQNRPGEPTSGGDGSVITLEDGTTFTYHNPFGGIWVYDPENPINDTARPNSWTPPLNQGWDFNKDKIFGVNLGGLFVLEPFITPALYQKYEGATDEWTLSTMMAADQAGGGLKQIEDHYQTFYTEQDIAEIAGAGLNWVRLPVPFWVIDTWPGEPFLAKTSWKYVVRVLGWCRKYGLRVNLDLHTVPGSQNGYNHSGRGGQINFLTGPMGLANAQRALNYIRVLAEFISQPEWKNVVQFFGILNEPIMATIGFNSLQAFYAEAFKVVRSVTGYGTGNGPYVGFHDGFTGPDPYRGAFRNADRLVLDLHPYFAFGGGPNNDPIATGTGNGAGGPWPARACTGWDNLMGSARTNYGITVAGEWSNGWNDCGLFVDGVGIATTYGGNCADWMDSSKWDDATKAGILKYALASMEALDSWFFWTWKIGNSNKGIVEAPLWSYKLGLNNGWMPKDPRTAAGTCASIGVQLTPPPTPYPNWMTGGNGAGPPENADQYIWPPVQITGAGAPNQCYQYTATAPIETLAPPGATASSGKAINFGSGWTNQNDDRMGPAPIEGCNYPDAWAQTPQEGAAPAGCLVG